MTSPHEMPLQRDQAMALLNEARLNGAVIVKAQYSPSPTKVERTLVYRAHGQRLRKVADVWLAPETYNEVLNQFPNASLGSCSAMYSTIPEYVWAQRDNELRLWHNGTITARFTNQECHTRGNLISLWAVSPNSSFAGVHAFLSKTWIRRGVRLERKFGRSVNVAMAKEPMAFLDPTYDGIDVMCDASWAADLAAAIASITGIKLIVDKGLS